MACPPENRSLFTQDYAIDSAEPEQATLSVEDTRQKVTKTSGTIHEAVAHLLIHFGQRKAHGTGFLCRVGNQDMLLTSAHNIVDIRKEKSDRKRELADRVVVFFGQTAVNHTPYSKIELKAADFTIPGSYRLLAGPHDWASLQLTRDAVLPYERFYLPDSAPLPETIKFYLAGYPCPEKLSAGTPGYPRHSMWYAELENCHSSPYHLNYQEWTDAGNSGSPVYYRGSDMRHCVVGIHAAYITNLDVNTAVLISQVFPGCVRVVQQLVRQALSPPPLSRTRTEITVSMRPELFLKVTPDGIYKPSTWWKASHRPGASMRPGESMLLDMTHVPTDRIGVCDHHSGQLICISVTGRVVWRWRPTADRTVFRAQYIKFAHKLIAAAELQSLGLQTVRSTETRLYYLNCNGQQAKVVGEHIRRPEALAVGKSEIYVYCSLDERVYALNEHGLELWRFYMGAKFSHLTYLPRNESDILVLADSSQGRLQAVTVRGEQRWTIDGRDRWKLVSPHGMCESPDRKHLLLADSMNDRVSVLSGEGQYLYDVATDRDGLQNPVSLTLTENRELLVGEYTGAIKIIRRV